MRRFIIGLLCGVVLSGATVAVAATSNEVKAILFPASLHFYIDGEDSYSGNDDYDILNYNDHLYIPLRAFSEKLGATVDYRAPSPGNTAASVDVYSVDDRDLTVRDAEGYASIGHLAVHFMESPTYEFPSSVITGVVKFNKPIPQGKQVVIEVLDGDRQLLAESEPIRLRYHAVGDMAAGEAATFEARFPYMKPVEGYQLQIRVVDETPWVYRQVDGYLHMDGDPLGISIGADHDVLQDQRVELGLHVINFGDYDVRIEQPVPFDIEIKAWPDGGSQQVIRTLQSAPLAGTVHRHQGALFTMVIWDQRDEQDKQVSPGEYFAEIVLPKTVKLMPADAPDAPDAKQNAELLSSMKTIFPIVIH